MTYPLSILNELHEYYPILLYEPSLFETSNDVVQYILEQSIHRTHRQELARYQQTQAQREQHEALQERIRRLQHLQEPQAAQATQAMQATQAAQVEQAAQASQAAQVAQAAQEEQIVRTTQTIVSQAARASQASQAPRGSQVSLTSQQQRQVEELEREMYGTVLSQVESNIIPVSTTSFEQFLTAIFESGLSNPRPRYPQSYRAPTVDQLSRATTVRELTENQDGICAICYEAMNAGQHVRNIHHCNHVFHQFCIDRWFTIRSTCPTCRHDIRSS